MTQATTKITFNTFTDMIAVLPNDAACRVYLENKLWNDGVPTCPHCGLIDATRARML